MAVVDLTLYLDVPTIGLGVTVYPDDNVVLAAEGGQIAKGPVMSRHGAAELTSPRVAPGPIMPRTAVASAT